MRQRSEAGRELLRGRTGGPEIFDFLWKDPPLAKRAIEKLFKFKGFFFNRKFSEKRELRCQKYFKPLNKYIYIYLNL